MAKPPSRLDLESVLRGRTSVDASTLCALIREVNPSGRHLSEREQSLRYDQKSRLQSLLIQRFGGEVNVGVEGGISPGIVLLLHRPTGLSAGHAVIAELSDDARSWVQCRVDMGDVVNVGSVATAFADAAAASNQDKRRATKARKQLGQALANNPGGGRSSASRGHVAATDLNWESGSATDLVNEGREALLHYDYDRTLSLFLKAHQCEPDNAAPALALVELWVEHLGADTDALAFADTLNQKMLAGPRLRGLLALAAARCGQRERALTLGKNLTGTEAAEVFVRLAALAISAQDVESATQDLATAKTHIASHPEFGGLESALTQLLRDKLKPRVDLVKTLASEGNWAEVEKTLFSLRQAGPLEPELRAIALEADEQTRRKRMQGRVEQATLALTAGDPETAVGLLRQALVNPAEDERPGLMAMLGEAESRLREAEESRAALSTIKLLGGADPTEALLSYLKLDSGAAARVRQWADQKEQRSETGAAPDEPSVSAQGESPNYTRLLHHLGGLGAPGGGARGRAAVAAVLVLVHAEDMAPNDPEGALVLLSPHLAILKNLPAAANILHKAEQVRKNREYSAALDKVKEATEMANHLLSTPDQQSVVRRIPGEVRRAVNLLSDGTLRHLPESFRPNILDLRAKLEGMLREGEMAAIVRKFVDGGDLAGARSLLNYAPIRPDGATEAGAITQQATVERLIQSAFSACVAGEDPREEGYQHWTRRIITDGPLPMSTAWHLLLGGCFDVLQITRRGRDLYFLQSCSEFAFLHIVDMAASPPMLKTTVILRIPGRADLFWSAVDKDRIVGVGTLGAVLHLSLKDFGVVAWQPSRPHLIVPAQSTVLTLTLASAGFSHDLRTLWYIEMPPGERPRLRVREADTLRKVHNEGLPNTAKLVTLREMGGATMAVNLHAEPGLQLRGADGKLVAGGTFVETATATAITQFPGGGLFAITRAENGEAQAVRLVPGESPHLLLTLSELTFNRSCATVDMAARRIFVLVQYEFQNRILIALSVDPETSAVTQLYRVPVPFRSLLTRDVDGHPPALLVAEPALFCLVPLGESPPNLQWEPTHLGFVPFRNTFRASCLDRHGPRPASVEYWVQALRNPNQGKRVALERLAVCGDPDEILDGARALRLVGEMTAAQALEKETSEKFPHHTEARYVVAASQLELGNVDEVRRLLEGADESALTDPMGRHFAHILAIGLLCAGQHEQARQVLLRGLSRPGKCELLPLLAMATPLPSTEGADTICPFEPSEPSLSDAEAAEIRNLMWQIAKADELLAKGDTESVIALLDTLPVHGALELQSSARLARAYLMAAEGTPERQLRKLFALALFLEHEEDKTWRLRNLFLRNPWTEDDLAKLAKEAFDWIGRLMGFRKNAVHEPE